MRGAEERPRQDTTHAAQENHQAGEHEHVHPLELQGNEHEGQTHTHIGCRKEHVVRLHRGVRKVLRRIRNHTDTAQNLPHTVRNHEQTVQRHRRTERRTVLRLSRLLNALGAGKRLAGCLLLSLLICLLRRLIAGRRCGYANTRRCLRRRNRLSSLSTGSLRGTALSSSSGRSSPGYGSFSLCRLYAGYRRGTRLTRLLSRALVLAHLLSFSRAGRHPHE
ncbi:Uncharacterised protein [Mycobacterium tuberculosis]|nr:Uncharacterised protein [Mycobacterium tuberculosis]